MIFNPKESINFEGDTGPYIQYSYARASSILRKAKNKNRVNEIPELEPAELELVKKLYEFPEVVLKAFEDLNSALIANYSYQISQAFNEFYHSCPVMGSTQEPFRLALIESFRQILRNALKLLGIKTLEEM